MQVERDSSLFESLNAVHCHTRSLHDSLYVSFCLYLGLVHELFALVIVLHTGSVSCRLRWSNCLLRMSAHTAEWHIFQGELCQQSLLIASGFSPVIIAACPFDVPLMQVHTTTAWWTYHLFSLAHMHAC